MLRIVRVLAPNPGVFTLEGTNTWVVGEDPSVVIDPGPDDPGHLDEVAAVAGRVAVVLVTHDHPDHAPGAVPFGRLVGAPVRAMRLRGAERLRDRERFRTDGVEVTTVATPGHTPDHLSFWIAGEGALFTGDAVLGRGTSVLDPPEGDLARYLRSLQAMLDLGPRTIYPGHGPTVLRAPEKLREYLAHRADREAQVLAALADGPTTIPEIVAGIYVDHSPDVFPLAERSVLAHLRKLEHDGRVRRTGSAEAGRYELHEAELCRRCGKRRARPNSAYCGPCSLAVLQGD